MSPQVVLAECLTYDVRGLGISPEYSELLPGESFCSNAERPGKIIRSSVGPPSAPQTYSYYGAHSLETQKGKSFFQTITCCTLKDELMIESPKVGFNAIYDSSHLKPTLVISAKDCPTLTKHIESLIQWKSSFGEPFTPPEIDCEKHPILNPLKSTRSCLAQRNYNTSRSQTFVTEETAIMLSCT